MKTMKKVIEENHKKGMEAIRKEYIKKRKRAKIIDTVFTILVIITTGLIIYGLISYTDKAIDQCVEKGNNKNYCVEKLG